MRVYCSGLVRRFLIRRLLQIHNGLCFEECSDWNITPVQYGILTILSGEPERLDIWSLAADLGVDWSNTADVARRLAGRGYITQNPAPSDRRMVISRITRAARDLLGDMAPEMQRSQVKLLAPLDVKTRETLPNAIADLVTLYITTRGGRSCTSNDRDSDQKPVIARLSPISFSIMMTSTTEKSKTSVAAANSVGDRESFARLNN